MSAVNRLRQFSTSSVESGSHVYLAMMEAADIIAEIDKLRLVECVKSQGRSISRPPDKEK